MYAGTCATQRRNIRFDGKSAFESFLSHADVKPSTYARYKTVIDLHILPKLGKRRVAGLTAKELSGYLAEKRRCGNLRTGGPLSEKSVRDLAVLLKSALRFAQKEFHIYTDALNMPLPSYKQKRVRVFSDQEVQRMAKEIQDVPNQKNTGILWPCAPECGSARSVR